MRPSFRAAVLICVLGFFSCTNPRYLQKDTDRDLIDQAIRSHRDEYRACYEELVGREPSVRGKVILAFVIGVDGHVSQCEVASTEFSDATFHSCLIRTMSGTLFQKQTVPTTVKYPFVYSKS